MEHPLVVDAQALQSLEYTDRGITRYVAELTRALLTCAPERVHAILLDPSLPAPPARFVDIVTSGRCRANTAAVLRDVPSDAWYLFGNVIELGVAPEAAVPPHVLAGPHRLASIVYDLIPLEDPERYLPTVADRHRYAARVALLSELDLCLCISAWTATRLEARARVRRARTAVIEAGVGRPFTTPADEGARCAPARVAGGSEDRGPFVLVVTGPDRRKNAGVVVDAWARLAPSVRGAHRLVVAGRLPEAAASTLGEKAERLGVAGSVELVGRVTDDELATLYRQATVLVMPSTLEGFGLPVIEAIACGCPAIAASGGALAEVLDWPPSCFDPRDADDLVRVLGRSLGDEAFRTELLARGGQRLARYRWSAVAQRALAALDACDASTGTPAIPARHRGRRRDRRRPTRPRVAVVTPLPPSTSGVAVYGARALRALAARAEITVFSETERAAPIPGARVRPVEAVRTRLANLSSFDHVLYCIGNSDQHLAALGLAMERPGVLWMHDVRLAGLWHSAVEAGPAPADAMRHRLARSYPVHGGGRFRRDWNDLAGYRRHGLGLSGDLVGRSRAAIVHSGLAEQLLRLDQPPGRPAPPIHPLFLPAPKVPVTREPEAGLVVSLGIVDAVKRPDVLLGALAALDDPRMRVAFVGPARSEERERIQRLAARLGLGDRVGLTGAVSAGEYWGWIARAECAVQLRGETNGETSGPVMELLAAGVPTVTNHPSAREVPPGAISFVPSPAEVQTVAAALAALRADGGLRAELAVGARAFAAERTPDRLADAVLAALGAT